ncbi:hypothetical protein P0M11_12060 [Kaistella sp. PBT33-4]|uniref:hypothetical protein n=1 Tax=Kaistella sp. PBT33-4 TaxID=3032000 RepID=UPI0023D8C8DD|nr:hypothetical protein [Kaistella sp. PBT33-4]MDF0720735.1 hypothetical protein [Kaistella sp. PBT33-4]
MQLNLARPSQILFPLYVTPLTVLPLIVNPENTLLFSRNQPEAVHTHELKLNKHPAHFAAGFKILKNGATYNTAFL